MMVMPLLTIFFANLMRDFIEELSSPSVMMTMNLRILTRLVLENLLINVPTVSNREVLSLGL
jgi:uncharacterized membrane protein